MVVATTVELVSRPCGLQIAGGEEEDGVAVDDTAILVGEEGAVGVAVEGDAHGGPKVTNGARDDLRVQGTAVLVDIATVGRGVGDDDFTAEIGEELRCDSGGCSVGAVDDDAASVEREAGDGSEEEADVFGAVGLVDRGCLLMIRCWRLVGGSGVETAENLFFDRDLGRVGELVAVGAEELDAVVLPWIVRGGDDDSGREAVLARQKGDGRGGDDAGALDRGSAGDETRGKRGGNPRSGLACVHSKQNTWRRSGLRQRVREG